MNTNIVLIDTAAAVVPTKADIKEVANNIVVPWFDIPALEKAWDFAKGDVAALIRAAVLVIKSGSGIPVKQISAPSAVAMRHGLVRAFLTGFSFFCPRSSRKGR